MFNKHGVWENQQVFLGRTSTGRLGYFTGNWIVRSLTEEDYNKPTEWHVKNCQYYDFDYVEVRQTENCTTSC